MKIHLLRTELLQSHTARIHRTKIRASSKAGELVPSAMVLRQGSEPPGHTDTGTAGRGSRRPGPAAGPRVSALQGTFGPATAQVDTRCFNPRWGKEPSLSGWKGGDPTLDGDRPPYFNPRWGKEPSLSGCRRQLDRAGLPARHSLSHMTKSREDYHCTPGPASGSPRPGHYPHSNSPVHHQAPPSSASPAPTRPLLSLQVPPPRLSLPAAPPHWLHPIACKPHPQGPAHPRLRGFTPHLQRATPY